MKIVLTIFFVLTMARSIAQNNQVHADSFSVASISGIVKEMLRLVSGEKGKQRDWERFRNLFLPTAHFTLSIVAIQFLTQLRQLVLMSSSH